MVTPSRSKPRQRRTGSRSSEIADWAVLFYIAGDVEPLNPKDRLAESLLADLHEILKAGGSREVRIAVQHDNPVKGARRYLLTDRSSPNLKPCAELKKIDSGSSEVLADFLRWGLSVCPAKRTALVLGGQSALAPSDTAGTGTHRGARVFTICRDDSAGGYMDVIDLGTVVRKVLGEYGREQLELLAIDSCQTQFMELAYELEGLVEVLLAPQYWVPTAGWDYTKVLQTWKKAAHQRKGTLDTITLVKKLVPIIRDGYRESGSKSKAEYFVSALDLRRLDDVARSFDTFCIGMLQVLGEGLIWKARALVLSLLMPDISPKNRGARKRKRKPDGDEVVACDCGSLFAMLSASLTSMADESTQGWLGVALQRGTGEAFDRFLNVAAQSLEQFLRTNKPSGAARLRLRSWVRALRDPKPASAGERMLKRIEKGIRDRIGTLHPKQSQGKKWESVVASWRSECTHAKEMDRCLNEALRESLRLLPVDCQVDYERQQEAASAARRLALQARLAARMLLGADLPELMTEIPSPEEPVSKTAPTEPVVDEKYTGMVVELPSTNDITQGWPRWSGVSLYRPPELDDLMNPSYQGFRFHQRIHWAALLGATNLIASHPRALWRLVSSLLATGSAGTRRDVLRRLTGPDSVIWGLRDQFRVMVPAPTLTLSLEQRPTVVNRRGGANATEQQAPTKRENYLLRLESANGGAVINEQMSRVQPKVLDRALQELDTLLAAPVTTAQSLDQLRAIGGLLGDDIFQTLGRTLEEERLKAQMESADLKPHLQLQIPRKLMGYPWELIHHNGEWLCEQFAIGRQVFMETGMARSVTRRNRGRVRPLIIGDPIFDPVMTRAGLQQLPGARAEAEQVAGWFEQLRQELGEVIDFDRQRDTRIHTRLTNQEFRDLLRHGNYDIIHFAGHGMFDSDDPETSAWMLSDSELWALEIRNTLTNHPAPPWLVYANACEAGMESRAAPRRFRGNVFGLATAFLTQGVAAYVAPLWPIDDVLAQFIGLNFYRQLLSERVTLGESLRRAKSDARRVAYPEFTKESGGTACSTDESGEAAWASLGWASLVLYGDPTEELFQALAGSESEKKPPTSVFIKSKDSVPPPVSSRAGDSPFSHGRQCVHAPDRLLAEWVAGPTSLAASATRGASGTSGGNGDELQLIEEAGLRRWRIGSGSSAARGRGQSQPTPDDGLRGSPFARLLADERLHKVLPGRRGVPRVIWRWTWNDFSGGLNGLVTEYDKDQVPSERLVRIDPNALSPWTSQDWLTLSSETDRTPRVLLVIHGTISKTASPVAGLGNKFLDWARGRYGAVLGFDHWTLSKTPKENAEMLVEQLKRTAPELLENRRLDIITHSRGGLVARALCELPLGLEQVSHAKAVRNLIFLGTPNCGTDLANSRNWGRMADKLVNVSGMKHAQPVGYLAGLLARLAVIEAEDAIPGLRAQNPEMAKQSGEFLHDLQQPNINSNGVRYSVITADFEPTLFIPNLKALWSTAKKLGFDSAADEFLQDANDLIVNTSHVWCLDQPRDEKKKLPKFLGDRALAFVPPNTSVELPRGVRREVALGVDHFNLFSQPLAQECMKKWLSET